MAFSGCSDVSYLSQILGLCKMFCSALAVFICETKVIIVLLRVTKLRQDASHDLPRHAR